MLFYEIELLLLETFLYITQIYTMIYIINQININTIHNVFGIKLNAQIWNKIDQVNRDKSNLIKRRLKGGDEGVLVMVDDKVFQISTDLKRN